MRSADGTYAVVTEVPVGAEVIGPAPEDGEVPPELHEHRRAARRAGAEAADAGRARRAEPTTHPGAHRPPAPAPAPQPAPAPAAPAPAHPAEPKAAEPATLEEEPQKTTESKRKVRRKPARKV